MDVFIFQQSKHMNYNRSNKKQNTPINSNTNYPRELKLVPINTNYCLFQLDALKIFLRVHLHGWSLLNFNFFNINSQICL